MDFGGLHSGLIVCLLIGAIIFLLYLYATRNFKYWHSKGIPYFKPLPFVGNLKEVVTFQRNAGFHFKHIYDSIKGQPYKGFFMFDQPVLMVRDLDLLKSILQKDFTHFLDKGITLTKKDELLGEALFSLKGQKWKSTRTKLSPGFSTSKLKNMYDVIDKKAMVFDNYFDSAALTGEPVLVKDIFGRYTTDIIAAIGFGIQCNALEDPNADFRENLKYAFFYSKIGALKLVAAFVDLPLFKLFPITTVTAESVKFFKKCVWNVVKLRQSIPDRVASNDYMDLLMRLDNLDENSKEYIKSVDIDIVTQAFTFLSAGFETTSSTILYTIYHLALDSHIQSKLRNEIQEAVNRNDGVLSYDVINSLPYLDMVVSETLRLYPTMPFIDRTCTVPYNIPGTDVVIDKGVFVYTSLLGIHRDPVIYPNPMCFNPENFTEENKRQRHKFAYMPFGEGPRNCIGKRLGLMVTKNAVCHILQHYEVLPCEKTPKQLEFDIHTFLLTTSHEVPLVFKKLN